MALASCSRQRHMKPFLTPPVELWPSNVLAATEVIRTSTDNKDREEAASQIEQFLWSQFHMQEESPHTPRLQPLQTSTVIKLLGPPATDPTSVDGSVLYYIIGHRYASDSLLAFSQKNGIVCWVSGGIADTAPCQIHDHQEERQNKTLDDTSQ